MEKDQIKKEEIKNDINAIARIIESYGGKANPRGNWDCPHGESGKKDLTVTDKGDCFVLACHCGLNGDIFDIVSGLENLDCGIDFPQVFEIAKTRAGFIDGNFDDKPKKVFSVRGSSTKERRNDDLIEVAKWLHGFVAETDYYKKRGFGQKEINESMFGYHPKGFTAVLKRFPHLFDEKHKKGNESLYSGYKYFIPCFNKEGKCSNLILRHDGSEFPSWVDNPLKVLNLSNRDMVFYNNKYLEDPSLIKDNKLFVVEGWADATSYEKLGHSSIAVNGVGNYKKVYEALKDEEGLTLIYSLDNDEAGSKPSKNVNLKDIYWKNKVKFCIFDNYNDSNDFLKDNERGFEKCINILFEQLKKFSNRKIVHLCDNSINHANIKYDETYKVENYLADNMKGIIDTFERAKNGYNSLFTADTGLGKTYNILDYAQTMNIKGIFTFPNTTNVEQIEKNPKFKEIGVAYGTINAVQVLKDKGFICITWDQMYKLLKAHKLGEIDLGGYILINDEIQMHYVDVGFRPVAITNVSKAKVLCRGYIDVTATPSRMDYLKYDFKVNYKSKRKTDYKVFVYDRLDLERIIDMINEADHKILVYMNDIKKMQYIQSKINKKSYVLHSNDKDNELYQSIISDGGNILDYEVVFTTKMINAGVSINDLEIKTIITINEKDIACIKQFVARARGLKKCNVHCFVSEPKDSVNPYNVEYLIKSKIKDYEKIRNFLNYNLKRSIPFTTEVENEEGKKTTQFINNFNECVFYDKEIKEYVFNEVSLRQKIYSSYYNKLDLQSFSEALKEYFEDITLIEYDEVLKPSKELQDFCDSKKALKEKVEHIISKNKELFVGFGELKKKRISEELSFYLFTIKKDKYKVIEEIENLIGFKKVKESGLTAKLKNYSELVLQKDFTVEAAWIIVSLKGQKKTNFMKSLDFIVAATVDHENPSLIEFDRTENLLALEILKEFQPGMFYKDFSSQLFIDGFLERYMKPIKEESLKVNLISTNTVNNIINILYQTAKKKHYVRRVQSNFYKEYIPTPLTNDEKRVECTIIGERNTIDNLSIALGLNDKEKANIKAYIDGKVERYLEK